MEDASPPRPGGVTSVPPTGEPGARTSTPGDAVPVAGPVAQTKTRRLDAHEFVSRYGTLVFIGLLMVYFTLASPGGRFLTTSNLTVVVTGATTVAILAAGLTVCLVMGDFDLSIANNAVLAGVIAAVVARDYGFTSQSFAIALAVGLLIGLVNGLVVTKLRVAPFIATLAMGLFILQGAGFIVAGGGTVSSGLPDSFDVVGNGKLLGVRYVVLIAIVVLALLWLLLEHTETGRYMYAIGGNPTAARLSGINLDRTRITAFVISGGCAALAGILVASSFNIGNASSTGTLLLDAFTAAFIGASTLRNGQFHIIGTAIGALVLYVLTNGMTLTGVDTDYQSIVKGVILILAVSVSTLVRRR